MEILIAEKNFETAKTGSQDFGRNRRRNVFSHFFLSCFDSINFGRMMVLGTSSLNHLFHSLETLISGKTLKCQKQAVLALLENLKRTSFFLLDCVLPGH